MTNGSVLQANKMHVKAPSIPFTYLPIHVSPVWNVSLLDTTFGIFFALSVVRSAQDSSVSRKIVKQ